MPPKQARKRRNTGPPHKSSRPPSKLTLRVGKKPPSPPSDDEAIAKPKTGKESRKKSTPRAPSPPPPPKLATEAVEDDDPILVDSDLTEDLSTEENPKMKKKISTQKPVLPPSPSPVFDPIDYMINIVILFETETIYQDAQSASLFEASKFNFPLNKFVTSEEAMKYASSKC